MARIIVIGAGLGGLPASYELHHWLGARHEVVLISEHPQFTFVPGLVEVGLGHTDLSHVQLDLEALCRHHGLSWVQSRVVAVDPRAEQVIMRYPNGAEMAMDYDYLVIASGASLALEELSGLAEYGHSICTPSHAIAAREAWLAFCSTVEHSAAPMHLVVGAAPGAGCFGPAYEFLLQADWDLRQKNLRDRVRLTYLTPEPYLGHLGLPNLYLAEELTTALMTERDIQTVTQAAIVQVTADAIHLADGRVYASDYTMILPAFKGADFVQASGLGNSRGFLPVNAHQRHRDWEHIYGIGVAIQLEQPDTYTIPLGIPKSGQMTEVMAHVAAHNIAVALGASDAPLVEATLEALCFASFGGMGIAYIAAPILPEPHSRRRRYSFAASGVWVHWAKVAFEYYFLWKMRSGLGIPWYERLGLRLLFGLKLTSPIPSRVTLPTGFA